MKMKPAHLRKLLPARPIAFAAIALLNVGAGLLWYAAAGVNESNPGAGLSESRADAQLLIAVIGCAGLAPAVIPAWFGRWGVWLILELLVASLFAVWLMLAWPVL